MLAVLLLGALLVLGVLGWGVYLLFFQSDPAREAGEPRPAATAPGSPGTSAPPGGGSGSSAVEGPASTEELESTARDYVVAVNGRDEAAATGLTCERADPGTLYSVTGGREVRLVHVEVIEGAVGAARVRVGDEETELLMEMQEDGWCVAI